jgi:hypothetical protein
MSRLVIVLANVVAENHPGQTGQQAGRSAMLQGPVTLFLPDSDGDHDGGHQNHADQDDSYERERSNSEHDWSVGITTAAQAR